MNENKGLNGQIRMNKAGNLVFLYLPDGQKYTTSTKAIWKLLKGQAFYVYIDLDKVNRERIKNSK